jgi:hypothetical protein
MQNGTLKVSSAGSLLSFGASKPERRSLANVHQSGLVSLAMYGSLTVTLKPEVYLCFSNLRSNTVCASANRRLYTTIGFK